MKCYICKEKVTINDDNDDVWHNADGTVFTSLRILSYVQVMCYFPEINKLAALLIDMCNKYKTSHNYSWW